MNGKYALLFCLLLTGSASIYAQEAKDASNAVKQRYIEALKKAGKWPAIQAKAAKAHQAQYQAYLESNYVYRDKKIHRINVNTIDSDSEQAIFELITSIYRQHQNAWSNVPEKAKVAVHKADDKLFIRVDNMKPLRVFSANYVVEFIVDADTHRVIRVVYGN